MGDTADIDRPGPFKAFVTLWPLVVLLVTGAAVVGEARYRLGHLEIKVHDGAKTQIRRADATSRELRKLNDELRTGLGRVQLSMARICIKLDVECD